MLKTLHELNNESPLKEGEIVVVFNDVYKNGVKCTITLDWREWFASGKTWWRRDQENDNKIQHWDELFYVLDRPKEEVVETKEEVVEDDGFKPFLYGIMRLDVPQMNPGKGMAQAMHLQNNANKICEDGEFALTYQEWRREASSKNFGTTIVLEATEEQWFKLEGDLFKEFGRSMYDFIGNILDDEYPMVNNYGEFFCKPMVTGFFVFAHNRRVQEIVRNSGIKLHR